MLTALIPLLRHQHSFFSPTPPFPKEGRGHGMAAQELKNLAATRLDTDRNWGLMPGLAMGPANI